MAGTCDEMKSVAEHAALLLGPELGSDVHFTLSYVESEEKQVTATTSSKHFPTGRVVSNIWWPQNYSIVYALTILMYYLMVRKHRYQLFISRMNELKRHIDNEYL